jgi:phage shock protein A
MGIFTRFRDIISSNINAMLDKAEDPEKLIRLMIREMEDTLVEIKTACAGVMAGGKKIKRQLEGLGARAQYWEEKAELAVNKSRDDLAREALVEKRKFNRRIETLEKDLAEHDLLIEQYQDDIRQLEEKLKSARDKQRMLVQRHIHAQKKMQAQNLKTASSVWKPKPIWSIMGKKLPLKRSWNGFLLTKKLKMNYGR